jgi:predicted nucleotidyltransferase
MAKMRLTEKQKNSIITTFITVFDKLDAELWLFGSLVNDNQLGGDIDLLIKCYKNYQSLLELKEKYDFLLQKQIGPRKIDIVLEYEPNCKAQPIIINAKKYGILLTTTSFIP